MRRWEREVACCTQAGQTSRPRETPSPVCWSSYRLGTHRTLDQYIFTSGTLESKADLWQVMKTATMRRLTRASLTWLQCSYPHPVATRLTSRACSRPDPAAALDTSLSLQ